MRKPTFNIRTRWVVAATVAAVVLSATVVAESDASAQTVRPTQRYSATQLSDAILFANGPAAAFTRKLDRPAFEQGVNTQVTETRIDAAIKLDKKFVKTFPSMVQSGNQLQVKAALSELGVIGQKVLNSEFGTTAVTQAVAAASDKINGRVSKTTSKLRDDQPAGTIANYNNIRINTNYYYTVLAGALAVIVVIVIALTALFSPNQVGAFGGNNQESLKAQEFVNSVANALRLA